MKTTKTPLSHYTNVLDRVEMKTYFAGIVMFLDLFILCLHCQMQLYMQQNAVIHFQWTHMMIYIILGEVCLLLKVLHGLMVAY